MKPSFSFFALLTVGALLLPLSLSAQIINIDFLAQRSTTDHVETVATTYVGQGPAGGGDIFNGVLALDNADPTNLNDPNDPSDNITVTGTNLLDSSGVSTGANFTIAQVGADHSGDFSAAPLNGAYLFLNSANNSTSAAPFTFTGLGSVASATLYFTFNFNTPTLTLTTGGTTTMAMRTNYTAAISPFTSTNTYEFANVPVIAGEISGTFNSSNVIILDSITIEAPEPSTWAILALGMTVVAWRLRRVRV